jgi:SAUR family protein
VGPIAPLPLKPPRCAPQSSIDRTIKTNSLRAASSKPAEKNSQDRRRPELKQAQMEQSGAKKSNKITEIVRMQRMLKKWRKLSVTPKEPSSPTGGGGNAVGESKAKKFLKRTLSFTDAPPSGSPPKGHLAVCVGPAAQRFVIPTEYLKHRAFAALLREAEEEFGFQQEGVLRIPCEVPVFESTLRAVEKNKKDAAASCYCSAEYAADEVGRGTPNNPLCR